MSEPNFRPHAAHSGNSALPTVADMDQHELPSHRLDSESAYVRAMLEELDDVIFSAVSGNAVALSEARELWPQVVDAIGWKLVEESREQYLRFALEITNRLETSNNRTPERAVAALEIIELLSRE